MARNKLSDSRIRTLQKAGMYSDGDGLFLRVRPSASEGLPGSKQFFFIYRRGTTRTEIGLGGFGQGTAPVSLALAREKAEAIRQQLARGEDPRPGRVKVVTFKEVMASTIAVKEAGFRNEKHKSQWSMTLNRYAADLHEMPIADITRDHIVRVLEPIWAKIPETADRLRTRIAAVMDHAKARDLFTGDNPADWRGGLKELLPARRKLTRGHHTAAPYATQPDAVANLRGSDSVAARAVEFIALTAARSGEARGATWDEIDLDADTWTVPASRMKMGKPHVVPLVARATDILRQQRARATGPFVFGGERDGKSISDTAMVNALRRATNDRSTLHGLRSSFRDWCGDQTAFPREVAEAALAHAVGDAVERAYRRGDALAKRREMMAAWASFLDGSANEI